MSVLQHAVLNAYNPGPMTGAGNKTYLVGGGAGAVLIDAGVGEPSHLADLSYELDERRWTLARVIVTHGHADHASGAPAVAKAHPHARFAKYPWPSEDARFPVAWSDLRDGDRIMSGDDTLVVIHTPGHSPDHIALWHEESRTAFTGDLVVQGSSVMIHTSRGGSLVQYLSSLERIRGMKPRRLLPAHGDEISEPDQVLMAYIEHRLARERQIIAALEQGRTTVEAIAETIYDGLPDNLMPAALENVRAHLAKLGAEGRAMEDKGRWSL